MSLEELNQKLKEQNLINTGTGFREPEPSCRPFLFEIRTALDLACA